MKELYLQLITHRLGHGHNRKRTRASSRLRLGGLVFILVSLVSATLITLVVSASRAKRAEVPQANSNTPGSAGKPLTALADRRALTPMFTPAITAQLTDNITSATKVVPGGTINYTAVISNTTTDATGVTYTDTLDANTTLLGSPVVSPIAFNDTYTATGNVQINVPVGSGVLVNDYPGVNPAVTTVSASDAACLLVPAAGTANRDSGPATD